LIFNCSTGQIGQIFTTDNVCPWLALASSWIEVQPGLPVRLLATCPRIKWNSFWCWLLACCGLQGNWADASLHLTGWGMCLLGLRLSC